MLNSPFTQAYLQSDLFGKLIFIALFFLSLVSWTIIILKGRQLRAVRRSGAAFRRAIAEQQQRTQLLPDLPHEEDPFALLYCSLRSRTIELLAKNRSGGIAGDHPFLSPSDIDFLSNQQNSLIGGQVQQLRHSLFFLSTIVSLAPFFGLLGTVWGILVTFSGMEMAVGGVSNQAVLGGLSLALTTTILGLVDAIPALIGYSWLNHLVGEMEVQMESFSTVILSNVELHYRQVDLQRP